MKIDRRSFLSFVIGGAAGTALSPLPWKLIDDSSIWSQNWAWTPVPQRGEITYVNSTCTLCPGGCGITVRKVGDRVVKIEGMMGHPVNDGNWIKGGENWHGRLAKQENKNPATDACAACHGADHLGTVLSRSTVDRELRDSEGKLLATVSAGQVIGCNLCHSLEKSFGN